MMKKTVLVIQLFLFTIVLIWSGIHPIQRSIWFFEVLPAIALILVLIFTYNRFPLTPFSYWVIFFGSIMMLIGGHYTYGGVPLFHSLKKVLHLKRNNFDRVGHIFQGMIFTVLIREYFIRKQLFNRENWLFVIVGMLSFSTSALFEVFEFGIAFFFDDNIQNFLGYQGDIFDSHWDLICALTGSIIILCLGKLQSKQMLRKQKKSWVKPTKHLQPN
jgi:putative membrane protein